MTLASQRSPVVDHVEVLVCRRLKDGSTVDADVPTSGKASRTTSEGCGTIVRHS